MLQSNAELRCDYGSIRLPNRYSERQNWRSAPRIFTQLSLNHRLSRQTHSLGATEIPAVLPYLTD